MVDLSVSVCCRRRTEFNPINFLLTFPLLIPCLIKPNFNKIYADRGPNRGRYGNFTEDGGREEGSYGNNSGGGGGGGGRFDRGGQRDGFGGSREGGFGGGNYNRNRGGERGGDYEKRSEAPAAAGGVVGMYTIIKALYLID